MKPTVMLIDFSNVFWTMWHANGDAVSTVRTRVRESIDRAAGTVPGALVAVCLDKGRSFRKEMLPEYKAQRPDKDAAVLAEMDRTKQALRDAGYVMLEADTFEADDVIATAATKAVEAGHPFVIASADKDLLQLLALPGARALRTHTWTMVEAKDVATKFGVEPESLGDWLALVGDKSDNVPGCPGVGDKRATDLLLKHGDLTGIYRKIDGLHVGTGTGGVPYIETKTPAAAEVATPAIVDALWKNRAQVEKARKLVTLRTDAPIRFEDIYEERKPMDETTNVDDVIVEAAATATVEEKTPGPTPAVETSLVVTTEYERQLEPKNSDGAIAMGKLLFNSRLYTRFGTPEAVTAVIIRGREMGLGALTALDTFHVIEGKPCPHAHLIVSLAMARPECDYFMMVESTNERATFETKHRKHPKPVRHTYLIQDAIDAGLCSKDIAPRPPMGQKDSRGNWDKRRAEMLRKTAAVQLVRIVYPEAALGLYAVEELGEAA